MCHLFLFQAVFLFAKITKLLTQLVRGTRAVRRITDKQLADIQKTILDCEKALHCEDGDEYYRANEMFHHLIYEASGNSFLASQTTQLHRRLKPFRRMQLGSGLNSEKVFALEKRFKD